jgi:2-aminoadipate transaminase
MRLNFSGVGEDEIREGIRRVGEVVREQVGLYGTLTGASVSRGEERRPEPEQAEPEPPAPDAELAKILRLPAKRKRAG